MEELTGRQFGSYRVVAALGQGGMAAIYKAFQPAVSRHVALKILSRHFTNDPEFFHRFRHEAAILAQLQHPHILPVFDFGEADGYAFLAMPFIDAGTLVRLLKGQPIALDVAERVMSQVGDALDYAHSKGIVHRDIKPSNILMDERGNCLVADFGIARMAEGATRLTMTGTIMGTPEYMSPEQALGEKAGPASDIYSLGIVLYEMLAGRVPFRADTPIAVAVKHVNAPLPPPRTLNPSLSPAVEAVVMKALARAPGDRFETAAALSKALTEALRAPRETARVETREAPPMETIVRRPPDRTPITPPPAPPPVEQTAQAPPVEQTAQAPTMATVVKPLTAAPLVSPPTSVTVVKPASGPIATPPIDGVVVEPPTRPAPRRWRKTITYAAVAVLIGTLGTAAAYLALRRDPYVVMTLEPLPGCGRSVIVDMSSDGRYVALMASCGSGDSSELQLILAERTGSALQVIRRERNRDPQMSSLTPDGRFLFSWQAKGVADQIVRYDRVSGQSKVIDGLDGIGQISQPSLSVSDDGRHVATHGYHFEEGPDPRTSASKTGAYLVDVQSGALTLLAECDCLPQISPDGQWVGWTDGSTMHIRNRASGKAWQRDFPLDDPFWHFGRSLKPQDAPVVYVLTRNERTFQRYLPISDQVSAIGEPAVMEVDDFHVASDARSILFWRWLEKDKSMHLFLYDLETEDVVGIDQFPQPSDVVAPYLIAQGGTNHIAVYIASAFPGDSTLYVLDR